MTLGQIVAWNHQTGAPLNETHMISPYSSICTDSVTIALKVAPCQKLRAKQVKCKVGGIQNT